MYSLVYVLDLLTVHERNPTMSVKYFNIITCRRMYSNRKKTTELWTTKDDLGVKEKKKPKKVQTKLSTYLSAGTLFVRLHFVAAHCDYLSSGVLTGGGDRGARSPLIRLNFFYFFNNFFPTRRNSI